EWRIILPSLRMISELWNLFGRPEWWSRQSLSPDDEPNRPPSPAANRFVPPPNGSIATFLALDTAGFLQALLECRGHGPVPFRRCDGSAGCCARDANGHAAAPPMSNIDSARFTRSPGRRGRLSPAEFPV